jgi:hypothetical protein
MSQREFEAYLTLLAKLLNLSPAQRSDVADELRDHLEERMTQLAAEGLSPEDAAHQAVSELGDAAGLARELSRPRVALRRRRILRCGFSASVAVAVAAFLFWPNPHPVAPAPVIAQVPAAPMAGGGFFSGPTVSAAEKRRAAVEKKLDADVAELVFEDTPLRDVLKRMSEIAEVPILFDRKRIEGSEVDVDLPIQLTLNAGAVSFRTALEMALSEANLIYLVREGVIVITTLSEEPKQYEVRVYPCNDLLAAAAAQVHSVDGGAGSAGPMGMGAFGAGGAGAAPPGAMPAPMPAAGTKEGSGSAAQSNLARPASSALVDVVMSMTDGPWEEIEGEGGNILEFGGMLIVRHKQSVHRKVDELLAKMREARAK